MVSLGKKKPSYFLYICYNPAHILIDIIHSIFTRVFFVFFAGSQKTFGSSMGSTQTYSSVVLSSRAKHLFQYRGAFPLISTSKKGSLNSSSLYPNKKLNLHQSGGWFVFFASIMVDNFKLSLQNKAKPLGILLVYSYFK